MHLKAITGNGCRIMPNELRILFLAYRTRKDNDGVIHLHRDEGKCGVLPFVFNLAKIMSG